MSNGIISFEEDRRRKKAAKDARGIKGAAKVLKSDVESTAEKVGKGYGAVSEGMVDTMRGTAGAMRKAPGAFMESTRDAEGKTLADRHKSDMSILRNLPGTMSDKLKSMLNVVKVSGQGMGDIAEDVGTKYLSPELGGDAGEFAGIEGSLPEEQSIVPEKGFGVNEAIAAEPPGAGPEVEDPTVTSPGAGEKVVLPRTSTEADMPKNIRHFGAAPPGTKGYIKLPSGEVITAGQAQEGYSREGGIGLHEDGGSYNIVDIPEGIGATDEARTGKADSGGYGAYTKTREQLEKVAGMEPKTIGEQFALKGERARLKDIAATEGAMEKTDIDRLRGEAAAEKYGAETDIAREERQDVENLRSIKEEYFTTDDPARKAQLEGQMKSYAGIDPKDDEWVVRDVPFGKPDPVHGQQKKTMVVNKKTAEAREIKVPGAPDTTGTVPGTPEAVAQESALKKFRANPRNRDIIIERLTKAGIPIPPEIQEG